MSTASDVCVYMCVSECRSEACESRSDNVTLGELRYVAFTPTKRVSRACSCYNSEKLISLFSVPSLAFASFCLRATSSHHCLVACFAKSKLHPVSGKRSRVGSPYPGLCICRTSISRTINLTNILGEILSPTCPALDMSLGQYRKVHDGFSFLRRH